jgi:hypothetical protein
MLKIFVLLAILMFMGVARGLVRQIIARIFGRAIGDHALKQQPDSIHLERVAVAQWTNPSGISAIADPLLSRGFEDAGTYRIPEMPVVQVRLLAHSGDFFYCAIYQHAQAGVWFDLYTRYRNGRTATFTTAKPTGLAPRPGHYHVSAPGMSSAALLDRARTERPRDAFDAVSATSAATDFEKGYADAIAWRKNRGISAREVAEVARQRKAA